MAKQDYSPDRPSASSNPFAKLAGKLGNLPPGPAGNDGDGADQPDDLFPMPQALSVRVDRKYRRGKTVTLVEGFTGSDAELQKLAKKLKQHCGTGGSVKDGVIVLQGDRRGQVEAFLAP